MDKTQTPPGRDGGSEDSGKKEHSGKPVKAKDFAKHAKKELNKAMDKNKARKMYELADQLSKVDTSKLNEQQVAERTAMIKRLGEELKAMKGVTEAANPKIDISATEKYALKVVNDLMYDPVGREARFLTKTAGLPFTYYNEDELQKTGVAKFIIPYIDDDTPQGSHGIGSKYEALENIWTRYFRGKQAEGWLSSQPRQMPTGKTTSDGKKIWTFVFGFAIPNKGQQFEQQGVAEGKDNLESLRAKAKQISDKIDSIVQSGGRVGLDDPLSRQLKAIRNKIKQAKQGVAEAPEDNVHASYNVVKLGGALNVDPRGLRMAIARGLQGNPTRTDMMTLSNAFLNLLKNSDDQAIQQFANLVKSGNPRAAGGKEIPQESTAAIAERNAFVDAMRQVKKGEEFEVDGKKYTKTTTHGESKVDEAISTEAYDRLKRVFDFSNFKG